MRSIAIASLFIFAFGCGDVETPDAAPTDEAATEARTDEAATGEAVAEACPKCGNAACTCDKAECDCPEGECTCDKTAEGDCAGHAEGEECDCPKKGEAAEGAEPVKGDHAGCPHAGDDGGCEGCAGK